MGKNATPALLPALCLLSGAAFAATAPLAEARPSWWLPLAAALVGLGWAWRTASARWIAWVATGLLVVWARPGPSDGCLERLDPTRPATLVGRLDAGWQANEFGWRSELSVRHVRQGVRVLSCRAEVVLSAGGIRAPDLAGEIRVKGFLKRYHRPRNGTSRHPIGGSGSGRFRLHVKSPRLARLEPDGFRGLAVERLGASLRQWVGEGFQGVENRTGVRAARSLLLGDRAALGLEIERSLRRFGLSHLFAVSGLHVAILGVVVHWLLAGLRPRVRWALTAFVVLGYLVLVGARPSIVRASAMAVLAFGALWSQRPPHSRQALSLAAVALVVLDPELIGNLAFRLTISATAGILWLAPHLEERWLVLWRPLRRALAATVAAQLASLPWAVSAFSLLYPLAPISNLIAIPWMTAFAMLSLVASAAMRMVPSVRDTAALALDTAIAPLLWLEALPASAWFAYPVACSFVEALLLSTCIAATLLMRSAWARCLAAVAVLLLVRGPSLPGVAEMIALDVGQGDAIVLHDSRQAILIDGGGWKTSDIAAGVLVPSLARLGIRRLSAVIVTHPDVDHCQGLLDLSFYLPIDRLLSPPGVAGSPCVRSLVAQPGMRWRELWRGELIQIGRIELESLHPAAGSGDRGNDSSLVLRAALGTRSVLLTGDIQGWAERRLLAGNQDRPLRSTILKLAHHGSKTSTTQSFLAAVAPRVAVASAGRNNNYGHPAAEVLERCRRIGIRVLRTDRDGMIRLPLEPHRRGGAESIALDSHDPGTGLHWERDESTARDSRTDGNR